MQHTPLTDLIVACLGGQERAQQQLYERFLPYVLTVLRRFGIEDQHHPDLVQETFIGVFTSLKNFHPSKGSFNSWLSRIAVNKTLNFLRKRENLKTIDLEAINPSHFASHPTFSQEDPPEYLIKMIAALPPGYRTVFNLYVVDGYSHQEIGKMLGISASGSRIQLHRAKSALKTAIQNLNNSQNKAYGIL